MAITEIFERNISDTGILIPTPLDLKIQQGIRVISQLTEGQEEEIRGRIEDGYNNLISDDSKEYGLCLAYVIDPVKVTVNAIEAVIHRTIDNDYPFGALVFSPDSSVGVIANGRINARSVHISKYAGPIAMNDNSIPQGFVYSLHGH